jgi:hypothetical protein
LPGIQLSILIAVSSLVARLRVDMRPETGAMGDYLQLRIL